MLVTVKKLSSSDKKTLTGKKNTIPGILFGETGGYSVVCLFVVVGNKEEEEEEEILLNS